MDIREYRPEELLGPLNETEQKHAPRSLFVAGNIDLLANGNRVAIVGSRKASANGLKRAAKLARILVERDVVVISGLAEGIDTAAHESAIANGGGTIAVLGTPLDQVFPKKNKKLQEQISRDHLLVSQFRAGYPVAKSSFILRNRTLALLCEASVIVEAGETSGAHSHGWETLRLGRPLFLMRSVVENQALRWPREMIDYGAQILSDESIQDFFEQIPPRHPVEESVVAF